MSRGFVLFTLAHHALMSSVKAFEKIMNICSIVLYVLNSKSSFVVKQRLVVLLTTDGKRRELAFVKIVINGCRHDTFMFK